jgi:acyl CoA:acetate/3-ketoacid CoA transferase
VDENTATASIADENVVSVSGKVVNGRNEAVTSDRLKRFAQKREQSVFVVSAQGELRPILQKY